MNMNMFGDGTIKHDKSINSVLPYREFVIDDSFGFLKKSTSKGNQEKYVNTSDNMYIKACFEYDGKIWRDDLVEVVATSLCTYLDIPVVSQGLCTICKDSINKTGSYSLNFLRDEERLIHYAEMIELVTGNFTLDQRKTLKKRYGNSLQDRFNYMLYIYTHFLDEMTARQYLENMQLVDALLLNEDRHENNYGVIYNEELDTYRLEVLYDFGLSLFEHDRMYTNTTYTDAIKKVRLKNISVNPKKVLEFLAEHGTEFTKRNIDSMSRFDIGDLQIPNNLARNHIEKGWGLK